MLSFTSGWFSSEMPQHTPFGLKEARLRPAGSGLYGSAAHRAAGGLQNVPAACGRLRNAFSDVVLADAVAARRCSTN